MTRTRSARRTAARTLLASALLAAAVAVPASAAAPRAAAPVLEETATQESRLVDHFYGAYTDAVAAEDGGRLATAVRGFYLTPALRARLADWEAANHADGVLLAQDVPADYRVTPGHSGAGHTWSTVRLTWGSAQSRSYTYLTVRSDLATGKISAIRDGE
ncbi:MULTISPECIES: hypothetical protein [unclassified Streptomyces]|uniref:hypothetical protein n=1 Tax=unclassified Streptomyces TaxID=2593676 RepID=UPI002ED13491|nr:hypothetical protein OH827_11125 [Streptomyces sp. NBC_00891]WSY05534.1 hypothetical protein OG464_11125 [Streptomyces sp. NBC_00890]WSZ07158.1 hypothetical protein OG704_11125 [Streptomyces sp. NBC_00869]WSZ25343.1 hypothetical protein OG498_22440 [Streptomyces sp. NBC_00870]